MPQHMVWVQLYTPTPSLMAPIAQLLWLQKACLVVNGTMPSKGGIVPGVWSEEISFVPVRQKVYATD